MDRARHTRSVGNHMCRVGPWPLGLPSVLAMITCAHTAMCAFAYILSQFGFKAT